MEKEKRYIVYLLFLVGIIMPVVPVFPHHHHAGGLICMKNDAVPGCCHDRGCIAGCFVQDTPRTGHRVSVPNPVLLPVLPDTSIGQLHFSGGLCHLLPCPSCTEPLHDACANRVSGLRAPPSLLA